MQTALVVTSVSLELRYDSRRISLAAIRWPERVIAGFLIYAAAMASVLPVAPPVRNLVLLLNPTVILTYGLLLHLDSAKRTAVTGVIRDWLPLGVLVIANRLWLPDTASQPPCSGLLCRSES